MINSFFSALIQFILIFASTLISIFTYPLYLLFSNFFPNLNGFFVNQSYFYYDTLLRGIAFGREVFFNITGFPRPLFYILVTLFLTRIAFHLTFIILRFIINVYNIIRGHIDINAANADSVRSGVDTKYVVKGKHS